MCYLFAQRQAMEKDAILGRDIGNGRIECYACARRCKIPEGSHGFCFVRQNHGNKLKLVNYGVVDAMQIDPVEKKPFNHFMPGSYVFGIGTSSCNWGCQFCQNHNISKQRDIVGVEMPPERIVEMALENSTQGIAFTYNEPTIFIEYALDIARLAHRNGLYTAFVTNGYMTPEAVHEMEGFIDAAVVNFKGNGDDKFSNKFEMVQSNMPEREALLAMKKAGIHIEITDLIIPRVGESLEACKALTDWIANGLGRDIPIHFTRFHPDYKMLDYPYTPYEALKAHYDVAKKSGLEYVYIGNVPGNELENTYCPQCGTVAIRRDNLYMKGWNLAAGNKCKKCGHKIPIAGKPAKNLPRRDIISLF